MVRNACQFPLVVASPELIVEVGHINGKDIKVFSEDDPADINWASCGAEYVIESTGKFLTMNCYGQEKVKRIERAFPLRDTYELIVYGDSQGDKEMLAYADHGYYKPFR